MTTKIKFCFHPAHLGASVNDHPLNLIVRALSLKYGKDEEWADKYGTEYEDEVIFIHRCRWCEEGCSCFGRSEIKFKPMEHDYELQANFWHKPSGFKMNWYKYIGRDTEINMQPPQELIQLVTEEDIKRVIEAAEESQKQFARIFDMANKGLFDKLIDHAKIIDFSSKIKDKPE